MFTAELTSFDRVDLVWPKGSNFQGHCGIVDWLPWSCSKNVFWSKWSLSNFFSKMFEKRFRNHKNELKWDLPISVLTPHQKLLSDLFPFYSFESNESERHQVAEAFEEFPSEFSFHRKIAPSVPSFSTPSFFSPPCSFCTAKVNTFEDYLIWPLRNNNYVTAIT